MVGNVNTQQIEFHEIDRNEFRLSGFYWRNKGEAFCRLPTHEKYDLPTNVDRLANYSAGGQLSFCSDTLHLVIHAEISLPHKIVRMPLTGTMGFDLYIRKGNDKIFSNVTAFDFASLEYCAEVFCDENKIMREFTLNFPLYARVDNIEIGVDRNAKIAAPFPWKDNKPIVTYGSSILQGACASRPGMCYTNILSRKLNRPILNFGFAGNAYGEKEIARVLSDIDNPSMYLIDYDPNAGADGVRNTLVDFCRIIRQKHSAVPIVTISNIPYPQDFFSHTSDSNASSRLLQLSEIHRELTAQLISEGDNNIFFIDGKELLGTDFHECSVDGCHLSDMGFYRMAEALFPKLNSIFDS